MNWWIGEFVVSFFDVANRLFIYILLNQVSCSRRGFTNSELQYYDTFVTSEPPKYSCFIFFNKIFVLIFSNDFVKHIYFLRRILKSFIDGAAECLD